MAFTIHTPETAPDGSKSILNDVAKMYGFTPNLYAVFAESPVALSTYIHILGALKDHAALTPQEQQLVMLAVSRENGCGYCVAAHSMVATMSEVPAETVAAMRDGKAPADAKQAALVAFAKAILEHRGWVPEAEQQAFLDAGYTRRHLLDVVSIVAMKTLSNYTNHIADTPVDPQFAKFAWSKPME